MKTLTAPSPPHPLAQPPAEGVMAGSARTTSQLGLLLREEGRGLAVGGPARASEWNPGLAPPARRPWTSRGSPCPSGPGRPCASAHRVGFWGLIPESCWVSRRRLFLLGTITWPLLSAPRPGGPLWREPLSCAPPERIELVRLSGVVFLPKHTSDEHLGSICSYFVLNFCFFTHE